MLDPSIIALLPTLTGGLLAIVGGIAGNYYLTSRTIKKEKRREFRDIFEEFSKCVYDIQICFGRTLLYPDTLNEERIKIGKLEGRIVILQMLYAPSLEKDCILFTDALRKATDALAEYFRTKDENNYRLCLDDFMIHAYKFRLVIADVVQKRGYKFY